MRKGLGYGLGRGYKNLVPLDTHIHRLSAKGVKTYYHVTLERNLKPILKKGLLLEHKKNVKISKKVNYVMDNLLDAGYFASKMKWEMEEQPLILQLNLNKNKIFDDKNTGAYSTWKEYHADIKPKQIKKVIHVTPEFWKGHLKRMDKKYEKATLGAKGFNFELTQKDYKDETYKSPVLLYNGKPVQADVNMHYHTFLKYWSVGYQWNYKQRQDGSFQNGTPAIKSEYAIHSRKEARALAEKYMKDASVEDINKLDKFYQDEISLSAKFSGYVNDKEVKFNSIKELKGYPYTDADKILIMGNKGDFFSSIKDIKEHVQKKTDKYGYSMNKKHKGMFGYYKKDEKKLDAKNFDYKKILNTTTYLGRIMWNPKTGEILYGDESHADLLRHKGKDLNINHWVRGIYSKKGNTLYVRHYFNPLSTYAEFTSKDFETSERLQKRFINRLRLPKDVKVEYNATNEKLRQEGYIHV